MVHRSGTMIDEPSRAPGAPDPSPPAWPPSGATPPRGARGRPALLLSVLVLAAFVTFSLGVSVGQGGGLIGGGPQPTPAYSPSADRPDWRLLDEAYNLLEQHYVDPKALDPLTLERGALVGMTQSLDDRGHTGYLTPEQVKARDESLSGTFVGVGAVLDLKDGRLVIVRVLRDSPAERAGVTAGDEILTVDGVSVAGMAVNEVVPKVRGPEGTKVTLELKGLDGAVRSVTITRAKLDLPLVSWAFAPGTRDAVIRLESFSTGAARAVASALREALAQGAEGVVLDLRGNPGGAVNEPVQTAGLFLRNGVVYVAVDRSGKETPHPVEGTALAPDLPLVVLVDGQTASSAEILTGALQDAGRARVVGVQTYGAGTIVLTYPLADGGALTIGVERWLTPKGRAIWREGIVPDEVVALPVGVGQVVPNDYATLGSGGLAASGDTQLKAAIAALDRAKAGAGRALDRAA